MKFALFSHSVVSCWNHGNAHFQRGIMRALNREGHRTVAYEPRDGWSRTNLANDYGNAPFDAFRTAFPDLSVVLYGQDFEIEAAVDDADVVIVHEWTRPSLIAALGDLRRRGGRFRLLFHDTHHRAVSDPATARALPIADYDAVLAFGRSLADIYRKWGWGSRVLTWHEAADVTVFRPPAQESDRRGLVWIGNWGDDERTEELERLLFEPVSEEQLPLTVYGVRYPEAARRRLAATGARYAGWLPNASVPEIFAGHLCTVHIPRRFYVDRLPGIPTIRMFEAMACGIPLVCAPWRDREGLFREGIDYLPARDGIEMREQLRLLVSDGTARRALRENGLERIMARHTCAHRVNELLSFLKMIDRPTLAQADERSSA